VTVPLPSESTNQRINDSAKKRENQIANQQKSQDQASAQSGKSAISNQQSAIEDDYPPSAFADLPAVDDGTPPMPEPPPDWESDAPAEPSQAGATSVVSLAALAMGVFAEEIEDEEPAPAGVVDSSAAVYAQADQAEPTTEPSSGESALPSERPPIAADKPALRIVPAVEPVREPPPERVPESPDTLPPFLVPPPTSSKEQVHMITCVLRTMGDKTRDVLRLRRIHGTVMSYPGNDRFAFHVFERGRGYLVEFPNFTTGVCPELIAKLQYLVGQENVRVEPITFQ
jgi:hypothetical protein